MSEQVYIVRCCTISIIVEGVWKDVIYFVWSFICLWLMGMWNTGNFRTFNGTTGKILPLTLRFFMTSCGQWTSKLFFLKLEKTNFQMCSDCTHCVWSGGPHSCTSLKFSWQAVRVHHRVRPTIICTCLHVHVPVCTPCWRRVFCLRTQHNTPARAWTFSACPACYYKPLDHQASI